MTIAQYLLRSVARGFVATTSTTTTTTSTALRNSGIRNRIPAIRTTVHRAFRTSAVAHIPEEEKRKKKKQYIPSDTSDAAKSPLQVLRGSFRVSKAAREKVWNVPNTLTFGRLFASPAIGYLILHDQHVAALSLFAVAGASDLVDGWIARRWNLQTVVGSVIDPMADKTLMTILTVCLAVKGILPVWIAGTILGRDVALAVSAIYFRWISLPPPKTMKRYWDFSLPSAEVHPTNISKLNTALQLALIGACVAHPIVGGSADWEAAFQAMQYTVATTTVWSGLSYIYSKDAVTFVRHPTTATTTPPAEDDKTKR